MEPRNLGKHIHIYIYIYIRRTLGSTRLRGEECDLKSRSPAVPSPDVLQHCSPKSQVRCSPVPSLLWHICYWGSGTRDYLQFTWFPPVWTLIEILLKINLQKGCSKGNTNDHQAPQSHNLGCPRPRKTMQKPKEFNGFRYIPKMPSR